MTYKQICNLNSKLLKDASIPKVQVTSCSPNYMICNRKVGYVTLNKPGDISCRLYSITMFDLISFIENHEFSIINIEAIKGWWD